MSRRLAAHAKTLAFMRIIPVGTRSRTSLACTSDRHDYKGTFVDASCFGPSIHVGASMKEER